MFGDMFDELEGAVQGCMPNPSKDTDSGAKFAAPPPLRGETGFCGIKNQGATCYLNSLIQTLLLTPEFRERLFRLGPDELGNLDDVKKKNAKVRIIPIQLQMLLARLLLLKQNACGTQALTESFGWYDNEELQQHDVQELGRILFCAIEDSLIGTSGHDIIKDLFRGVTSNTITCFNCQKISERPEDFLDLNIAIAGQSSLIAVLRDMFLTSEIMSGCNMYHCNTCNSKQLAKKASKITVLPPILTVSLLRFAFDYKTLRRFKETRKFEFPLTLNMRPYCEKGNDQGNNCYEYDLYSVIVHSGGAHGGHYYAYIRDVDGIGKVPPDYNPSPPRPPPPAKNVSPETEHLDDPLETVATILGKLGGENVPLNKLGEALREDSGSSWSRQYKRKYGTMIKFLQGNYETFSVDTRAKTVSFRSRNSSFGQKNLNDSIMSAFEACYSDYESGDGFPKADEVVLDDGHPESGTSEQEPVKDEETNDDDYHPLCNVWFDFNDSHVKAITTHEIATQFEGRESAYMLFYRRRDLRRPLASLGNSVSSIPGHILARIQKENSDLEDLRNEYDVYLNVVTIQVFFPSMFKYEDGLIKLTENENGVAEHGFPYSVDRRKTVAAVYADLLEMLEKHNEPDLLCHGENLKCNLINVLDHQGIHVYEQIDKDRSTVISDSLLENDQKVLVWNGADLHGINIHPGKSYEPKVVNVHVDIEGDNEISSLDYKGVACGNVSIQKLLRHFVDEFQLKRVTSSTIAVINEKGNLTEVANYESKLSDVITSSQGNFFIKITLEEDDMEDKNGQCVTLTITLTDNLAKMFVKNKLFCAVNDVFVLTSVSCIVKVSSFIFIEHLKSKIPRWFFPRVQTNLKPASLNLCIDNIDTVGSLALETLSLHEQQSLANAGLSTAASVKLDDGKPLNKNVIQVAVCVQRGSKLKLPVKKSQFVKVDCLKAKSVSTLIDKIVSELSLQKDAYHLRTFKSDKEVGDAIMNPDIAVEKTPIRHGSAVILCPGGAASEGQIRIPVLYFPALISFDDLRIRIRENPSLSPWCPFLDEKDIHPVPAGHITIDKDSTVFDLKQEVVELDYFKKMDLTAPEDICLRSVSHKLPTRFHIQESATIKRLRLGPTSPLAVSRISCIPHDGYTALRLSFNVPGTRIYANDCELQWEKTANLSQFPARLAEIFDVPLKEVLVARRADEAWLWEILKSRDSDTKEKRGKNSKQKKVQNKSKTKKASIKLCTSPQDGDILRVKRIIPNLESAPDVTDFKTDEDLTLHARWHDSRQKESSVQSKEKAVESNEKVSKPKREETLHIHVDKF